MNTIFNKQCVLAALLLTATGVMTGCGGDDPAPTPTESHNTQSSDKNQQEQPISPEVKVIDPSAIEEDTERGVLSVSVDVQAGGSALMTVTKGSVQFLISGSYDSETRGYIFNLSHLEMGENYQYVISVYDKDHQKVMESKSRSITIPESVVIDADGSGGGSDGTRGGGFFG
jgi:hypothetical protein